MPGTVYPYDPSVAREIGNLRRGIDTPDKIKKGSLISIALTPPNTSHPKLALR